MKFVNLFLFLLIFLSSSFFLSFMKKEKQVDVSFCINSKCLKKIEDNFGLFAEGSGYARKENMVIPLLTFICYEKMVPEEAYELYFKVTSFLQEIVSECLSKKGLIFGKQYKEIPLKISVLFFTPKRDFQSSPCVATVSVVKDSVVMRSISSPTEPLQTLVEYPLKEFEEKVFGVSEETCESNPTSHQSRKKPMHYRKSSR